MGFLIDLLLFIFVLPVFLFFAVSTILKDVADYYGLWLPPAVFGLTIGVHLQIIGPSAPDAEFESLLQALAGSHVMAMPTPLALIGVAAFCLLVRPACSAIKVALGKQ